MTERTTVRLTEDLVARAKRKEPGERHWSIFKRLCAEVGARGPLICDAWHTALAVEHGCRFITFDRDFARFPGLDWREPG
jgi:hypothetical protein